MSRFFIDRPIFAWVLAIVLMMAGALAIFRLPVEQYPRIAPPSVQISAYYPGASAETVENTVTQVIEQKMNGIDNLRYMASTSDSAGNVSITITFDSGTNADIAQVQVQNKLQLAMPLLPQEVQDQGVKVAKASSSFLIVIGVTSRDGRYAQNDLADLLISRIQDPISRVTGVGDVTVFGAQYSMRIWLNPDKLVSYALTTNDVIAAVRAENADISVGQLGGEPAMPGQQLNATILAQSRMQTIAEFENILVRVNSDGSRVLLKDVSRIEKGAENYATKALYSDITRDADGKPIFTGDSFKGFPSAGMGIKLASGANALDTVARVQKQIDDLQHFFPEGVDVVYPYDTTPFVRLSIEEVVRTLIEAIVLVFLVMYLFLQSFRATIIPTIAVPVVLLGTFAILSAFGFSINTLTMFAMVLAIGLLVDDAIVVVENVERVMEEEGLPPYEATRRSMDQISGALIGIALVLSAVFVPMAFFSGSVGVIYRQFSLTMVSAMALSVMVALILTPALCATILKGTAHGGGARTTGFFGAFNRFYEKCRRRYAIGVRWSVTRPLRHLLVYGGVVALLIFLFMRLPTAFLPDEDQGIMLVQVQTPAGATTERTALSMDKVRRYFLEQEHEAVETVFTITGFSFSGRGQNGGLAFIKLRDWGLRKDRDLKAPAVVARSQRALSQVKDASIYVILPPAIVELGNATGFNFQLVDRGSVGHEGLMAARNQLLGMASQNKHLMAVRPNGMEDVPQYRLKIDRNKAMALGLSISDINATLSTAWGSSYVNDFIDQGRVKKVYAMADARYRMLPEDINRWEVRNSAGEMVPFSTFTSSSWEYGSPQLERYNGVPSRNIQGQAAPGFSSGSAMNIMEQLAAQLPRGIAYEWTGLSYEERLSGAQAPALYAISIIVVFLCLAALYESWTIPLAVMLVVPLGVFGTAVAANSFGLSDDVYFQVGLLTTMGLSAKNAILIVEFAKQLYEEGGKSVVAAAIEAAQIRLRPIIMTSMAFILGVTPLAINSGAGSGAQNAIGIGVIGGMISATVLAVIFVPVFFVVVETWLGGAPKRGSGREAGPHGSDGGGASSVVLDK